MGHHANQAAHALEEVAELDDAVTAALGMLNSDDSLIVVTADHSHVFTMGGYPERGKDILGVSSYSEVDGYPVTTLAYANGPGYNATKVNYTDAASTQPQFRQRAAFPLKRETHGGEEVAVYATGPYSHLFSGVHDQTYIPYVLSYSACIGRFAGSRCHATCPPNAIA